MGTYAPTPLAFFITFTTYGTRLHGDPRGTVTRQRNQPGTPLLPPNVRRHARERKLLCSLPFLMDAAARDVVRRAIEQTCELRSWVIHAINVRTNHVHIVVTASLHPEAVMRSLKAWSTRWLREHGLVQPAQHVWTRHGSTIYLWKPDQLQAICRYVVEGQGDDLAGGT